MYEVLDHICAYMKLFIVWLLIVFNQTYYDMLYELCQHVLWIYESEILCVCVYIYICTYTYVFTYIKLISYCLLNFWTSVIKLSSPRTQHDVRSISSKLFWWKVNALIVSAVTQWQFFTFRLFKSCNVRKKNRNESQTNDT
jgi:hypothetical protein